MTARRPQPTTPAVALTVLLLAGCATSTSPADVAGTATSTAPSGSTAESTQAPISPRISVSQGPLATDPAVDGYPLGEAVALDGGYTVTVQTADLDATAEMATLVPGLTPTNGRFVLVTLAVRLTGQTQPLFSPGVLVTDLRAGDGFFGRCDGTGEAPLGLDVAVVAPGETQTWQECLDVTPEAAVPTAQIRVADTMSPGNGAFAYWSLG